MNELLQQLKYEMDKSAKAHRLHLISYKNSSWAEKEKQLSAAAAAASRAYHIAVSENNARKS